jgi:hypothetical protein
MMNQACHSRVPEFPTGDIFVTLSCGSRRKIGLRRFRIVGAIAIRGSQHSVRFSGLSSMPNASSASQLSEDCRWGRLRSVDGSPACIRKPVLRPLLDPTQPVEGARAAEANTPLTDRDASGCHRKSAGGLSCGGRGRWIDEVAGPSMAPLRAGA